MKQNMASINERISNRVSKSIIFDFTAQEMKFLVHFGLSKFWALAGVWVIFLTAKGLTLTEVAIVESVFMGSIFLFEVPTGYVADKFGRKNSLILSFFTQFVGIILLAFSNSFLMYCITFGIWGIGMTMNSGADQAWVYDEVKYECNECGLDVSKRYQRVYGFLLSIGLISTSLSYVVGGYLAVYDLRYPILLTSIMFLFTMLWLFTIKENKIQKEQLEEKNSDLKQAIRNFKSPQLVVFTYTSMLIGGIVTAFFYWMQPYLVMNNVKVQNIGWLLGFGVLLASVGSSMSSSLTGKFKENSLLALILGSSFAFVLMSIFPYFGVIGLFFVIRFLRGAFNPYLSRLINQSIPTEGRATTISIISALTTFSIMAVSLGSAWLVDNFSFQSFFFVAGSALLVTVPFLMKFNQRRNSEI